MRGASAVFAVAMVVAAAIGACTGSDPEPVGPPPVVNNNYFGPDGSSSGAVTSSSGGSSGSASSSGGDAGSDAGSSRSIACGGSSCLGDNFCCIEAENADPVCVPEGTACTAPSEMHCDSTDDCTTGMVCCATPVASDGGDLYWRSSCDKLVEGRCPGAGRVLCRSARDCVGVEDKCESPDPSFRPVGYNLCK